MSRARPTRRALARAIEEADRARRAIFRAAWALTHRPCLGGDPCPEESPCAPCAAALGVEVAELVLARVVVGLKDAELVRSGDEVLRSAMRHR